MTEITTNNDMSLSDGHRRDTDRRNVEKTLAVLSFLPILLIMFLNTVNQISVQLTS